MSVDSTGSRDARTQLVREKYFCVRPRPLEQWLWSKRVPGSAERVFWLHWQEGMQRGDWCSELPIRKVARECQLDVSTVTRAYQLLAKLGCLRRSDPGRDPANPFQQATAITEIRLPREFLVEINRHPNRRPSAKALSQSTGQGRADPYLSPESFAPIRPGDTQGDVPSAPCNHIGPAAAAPQPAPVPGFESNPLRQTHETTQPANDHSPTPIQPSADLFPGLTGRARLRAIADLTSPMTPAERQAYQEAIRLHLPRMDFAADTQLSPEARSKILRLLTSLAQPSTPSCSRLPASTNKATPARRLSTFDLSRLRHELQSATSITAAPELLRQVVWSVETGALRRFETRHALHIALKKIRQGLWTRPNRMPPNWARALSHPTAPEPCGHA